MKQISKSVGTSQDIPKNHEYGPSSENRPSGKRGYSSTGRARTTHLKEVKRTANKQRRATKRRYPDFEDLRNRNYEEIKDSKFPSNCKLFIEVPKVTDNKPLPTDIIVRDSDRVGYPVAIGKMLPRILARIGVKS